MTSIIIIFVAIAIGSINVSSGQQIQGSYFRVNGVEFQQNINNEWVNFGQFAGLNLGVTSPGHLPGEVILRKSDYIRRFQRLEALNVKVIRVYSLLHPEFYETLVEWNKVHEPFYVLHGTAFPEEEIENHGKGNDVYRPDIFDSMKDKIERTVRGVFGTGRVAYRFNQGDYSQGVYGDYKTDISKYLLGWVIGGEIAPHAVYLTNSVSEYKNCDSIINKTYSVNLNGSPLQLTDTICNKNFKGKYFQTTGDSSAFEAWVAMMLDFTAETSVEYGVLAPISQTNWVTLDGIKNYEEGPHDYLKTFNISGGSVPHSSDEDWQEYNQKHIQPNIDMGVSMFYNEHIYPYYPEFLTYHKNSNDDAYFNYLDKLLNHYNDKPFVITEIGLSTSIGQAASENYGRNHGGVSDKDQGLLMKSLILGSMNTTKYPNMQGILVFQLHNEWFKRSWNTLMYDDPVNPKRHMWHNVMSAEEGFGIYKVEPFKSLNEKSISTNNYNLKISHHEMFLTFEVELKNNNQMFIGIDNIPGGSRAIKNWNNQWTLKIDSYISITENNVEFKVNSMHDPFLKQYGNYLNNLGRNGCYNNSITLDMDIVSSTIEDNGIFSEFKQLTKTPTLLYKGSGPRPDSISQNCISGNWDYKDFKFYTFDINRLTTKKDNKIIINIPYHVMNYRNPSNNERVVITNIEGSDKVLFNTIQDKEPINIEVSSFIGNIEIEKKRLSYQLTGWTVIKSFAEKAKDSWDDYKEAFTIINKIDNGINEKYNYYYCFECENNIQVHSIIVKGSLILLIIAMGIASIGKVFVIYTGYCYSMRQVKIYNPHLITLNFLGTCLMAYLLFTLTPSVSFLNVGYIFYITLIMWDSLLLIVMMLYTPWNLKAHNERVFNGDLHAFVIACHNSSDVIAETVLSLLEKVKPENIYIADNGSSQKESEKTKMTCNELSVIYQTKHNNEGGMINYGYMTIGNKTIAQYGAVSNLPEHVKFVTCIDDDTRLDKSWDVNKVIKYFEDDKDTAVLAYPLTVWNPQYDIEWFQALEYLVVGFIKIFHSKIYSTIFNSGAFGTYRVNILKEAFLYHNTDYHGDDLQICMHIHQLKGKKFLNSTQVHEQDYKVAVATDMIVDTIAPKCWVHLSSISKCFKNNCDCGNPDLLKQRCKGWFVSQHRFIPRYIKLIFNVKGINGSLWVRLVALYELITIINEYLAIFYIIFFMRYFGIWLLEGLIIGYAFNVITMTIFNWYILRKNDLYIPYEVITIQPLVYKVVMITIYRYLGLIYNIYYTFHHKSGIQIKNRLGEEKFIQAVRDMFSSQQQKEQGEQDIEIIIEQGESSYSDIDIKPTLRI